MSGDLDLVGAIARWVEPWLQAALREYPFHTLVGLAVVAGWMQVGDQRELIKEKARLEDDFWTAVPNGY